MNKKRLLPLLIIVVMAFTLTMSGCSMNVNRDQELQEAHNTIHEDLTNAFEDDALEFPLLSNYLEGWALNGKLDVLAKADHYIVLENPATEDADDSEPATLQCSIDTAKCQNSLYVLSTAMTALLGPVKHNRIRLIVTEYADGQRVGAASLNKKYLADKNIINLQNAGDVSIYTQGAYAATGTITSKAKKVDPKYSEAYTITLAMSEYTDPFSFDKKKNYPNPIATIGNFLASNKSAGKLFEIADFTYEAHEGYAPYSASATIVIDKNNVESIKKKFDKSYDNMEDKFDTLESEFTYTMTEADMPDKVLSDKSTNNLISLMYTLNTGNCLQDEETGMVYASSYISSIKTENGKLNLDIKIRTRGEEYLDEIAEIYDTTAGLCSTKYSQSKSTRVWASVNNTALASYFTEKFPAEEASSNIAVKTYDNDYFYAKNRKLNIITVLFSKSDSMPVIFTITHYLNPDYSKGF